MALCSLLFLLLCGAYLRRSHGTVDATCNTAGVARAAFRDRRAVAWLNEENIRRAPYYIAQAKRMYEKGLRQMKGIDKSNTDPFIALYDAQHQVLAALDLAPRNASIWLSAGQAMAMISSLDEGQGLDQAREILAEACNLEKRNIDEIVEWSKAKVAGEEKSFTKIKKSLGKSVASWKKKGVPTSRVDFLPKVMERVNSEVCAQGAEMPQIVEAPPATHNKEEQIEAALASMVVKPVFPTLITSLNLNSFFGANFSKKLADIAIKKYETFSAEQKKKGKSDPNDINDAFFSLQRTSENAVKADARIWPELYKSAEFHDLWALIKKTLVEHAVKTGYHFGDEGRDADVVLWAAVYLSDGGRHGYHVHQSSLSSCVFYAQAPSGTTPLMFIDPRGAPPTHDYEQHLGERDFEPVAPFHHNYNFFAQAGDLVCFPSWLVHRVPSHLEREPRVAFAANLQAHHSWDAWYRSATLP
eukprot:TRINITY_DN13190_c0_g1_i1.p1 TRINITY_DN13190_c0_g1~~TRINITY_DN13190_c0_g1_i1.p1  ORF type:complete len:492 (+),score=77.91 TRINITY_DN13190_c0_g1_i1:65-1477(+)